MLMVIGTGKHVRLPGENHPFGSKREWKVRSTIPGICGTK